MGLQAASDAEIWRCAVAEDAVIITKDDDFLRLYQARRDASVVWVRIGNCSNAELVSRFEASWPAIKERLEAGERLIELR